MADRQEYADSVDLKTDGKEKKCGPPDLIIMDMLMKGMDGNSLKRGNRGGAPFRSSS
jgi:hypothetical protein